MLLITYLLIILNIWWKCGREWPEVIPALWAWRNHSAGVGLAFRQVRCHRVLPPSHILTPRHVVLPDSIPQSPPETASSHWSPRHPEEEESCSSYYISPKFLTRRICEPNKKILLSHEVLGVICCTVVVTGTDELSLVGCLRDTWVSTSLAWSPGLSLLVQPDGFARTYLSSLGGSTSNVI